MWKILIVWPIYDPQEVVNIAAVYKIDKVLLSSQAMRPIYDPQLSVAVRATDNIQNKKKKQI